MKQHIAALDGLRGIAALLVVLMHLTGQTRLGPEPHRGYLAVDFFFVLSGFVIASSYGSKLAGGMSTGEFLRIRLIRLYPLVFLGLIIGFIVQLLAFHVRGPQPGGLRNYHDIFLALGLGLLFLPYLGHMDTIFPLDFPIWSLMFEMIANVIYPPVRRFGVEFIVLITVMSALGLVLFSLGNDGLMNGGWTPDSLGVGLARVGFSFFIGVLIYRAYHAGRLTLLSKVPFWLICLALILSAFVPLVRWGAIYELGVVLVLFPLLVAIGSQCRLSKRTAVVALFLGRISYPIYVLHAPLFAHLYHLPAVGNPALIAICTILLLPIVAIGWAASVFYDEPVRRWLYKLGIKGRSEAQAGAN